MLELLVTANIISVLLFIVGFAFIVAELFQPGFGFFGICGIIILIVDVFYTADTIEQGLIMAGIILVLLTVLTVVSVLLASKGILPKKLVLQDETDKADGFSGTCDFEFLMGLAGVTVTPLRPSGIALISGKRYDVVSSGEFLDSKIDITVKEVVGNRIVVSKTEE